MKETTPPNPLPCGCRVTGANLPTGGVLYVVHCPLHAAAEEMACALRGLLLSGCELDEPRLDYRVVQVDRDMMLRAQAALRKAELKKAGVA